VSVDAAAAAYGPSDAEVIAWMLSHGGACVSMTDEDGEQAWEWNNDVDPNEGRGPWIAEIVPGAWDHLPPVPASVRAVAVEHMRRVGYTLRVDAYGLAAESATGNADGTAAAGAPHVLRTLEWSGTRDGKRCCPVCEAFPTEFNSSPRRHEFWCTLAAALAGESRPVAERPAWWPAQPKLSHDTLAVPLTAQGMGDLPSTGEVVEIELRHVLFYTIGGVERSFTVLDWTTAGDRLGIVVGRRIPER